MRGCPSCGEQNPERARFCLGCGQELTAEEAATAGVRRTVSVVFADLAGSTVLAESLDAEPLRYVTGRFFEAMSAAVATHGGTVEKFIGDAVVAIFGLPRVREDDALRAVRADSAGEACLVAADVEHLLGNPTAEREHLRSALAAFTAKGNVVRERQVAERLSALSA